LGVALLNQEQISVYLLTILIALVPGLGFSLYPMKSKNIRGKEGLAIVALGWIVVAVIGSLPFYFSGSIPSFVDAFFETMSGLTTTGATILDNIEVLPRGILFWRSFTHWLGGMGILVLTLAILPAIGVGGFRIYKAESTGPISDKLVPKMKDTAKILYTAYLGMTVLQTVLLLLGNMDLYDSLIHTFGTVGTGGFSTRGASVGAFNSSYINIVISVFMVAAGVNFSLYYELYKKRWSSVLKNTEFKVYLGVVGVSVILLTVNLYGNVFHSLFDAFQHSFFQAASFITTTGFTTVDYEQWTSFSKALIFLLMFVGGSAGSTGGSVKIVRWLIVYQVVRSEIARILHPNAYVPVKVNERVLPPAVVSSVTGFVFLYFAIFVVCTLLISLDGIELVGAASSVAATLGNVGPGFDIVGPTKTFSQFSAPAKLLLSMLMLLGRLELFTVFVLLTPNFWRR